MKKISILSGIVAIIALAASCETKVEIQDNPVAPQGEKVTITADLSSALTKVTFTPGTDGSSKPILELTWKSGDKLRVADHADNSSYSDFDLDGASVGQKQGIFTGTPVSASSYDVWVVNEAIDFADQAQSADADPSGLQYNASIEDITDLSNIAFTDVSSVLMFTAKNLPAGVAATIKSMDIKAFNSDGTACNIFDGDNSLKVTLAAAGDEGSDNNLVFYASLPKGSTAIPAGTSMLVKFNAPGEAHDVYTRYFTITSAVTLAAGKLNEISVGCANVASHAGAASCDGSNAAKAYLIGDKYQMLAIDGLMVAGETKYFKLLDNIDMTGAGWEMLNAPDPYNRLIDFDGNNKTISNIEGTMFYVFKGSIKNLTLDNPTITNGNQKGAFAQYVQGTNNIITNVDVCNVASYAASSGNCGGFIGRVNNGSDGITTVTIEDCDVTDIPVNSSGRAGGFIGFVEAKVIINNCSRKGSTVSNTANYTGGFIAQATADITISNCNVDCTVSGANYSGGLVGAMTSGTISSNTVKGSVGPGSSVGGLVGYVEPGEGSASFIGNTANCTITGKTNIGGFIGNIMGSVTISKSCSIGASVTPTGNAVGGFIGHVNNPGISISDCFSTTSVLSATSYRKVGGFIGQVNTAANITITRCYASGSVTANFEAGGLIGHVPVTTFTMSDCAAWNSSITANSRTKANWSSGSIIGVTHPNCHVSNCFRNPAMTMTIYPIPADDFDQPDVDGTTSPLYWNSQDTPFEYSYCDQTSVTAGASNCYAARWAYHGKHVDTGLFPNLSALASASKVSGGLGWSSEVWDFTGALPVLK